MVLSVAVLSRIIMNLHESVIFNAGFKIHAYHRLNANLNLSVSKYVARALRQLLLLLGYFYVTTLILLFLKSIWVFSISSMFNGHATLLSTP